MAIPMMLAAGPLVGYFLGLAADRWLGTAPWGATILTLVGFAAGVNETIQIIKRVMRDKDRGD
jgi:F0F1-type ATP synthase assembly protein I